MGFFVFFCLGFFWVEFEREVCASRYLCILSIHDKDAGLKLILTSRLHLVIWSKSTSQEKRTCFRVWNFVGVFFFRLG